VPGLPEAFPVVNPQASTLRVDTTHRKVHTITEDVSPDGYALRLPADRNLSLRVLEGEEQGTVYPVNKPRITIGRTNVDVTIDDQMTSRVHGALEVSDEGATLRDLGSTNGMLVNNKPIDTARLSGGSTFRIGNHVFQLVIARKGA
jgi:hypothetical protein